MRRSLCSSYTALQTKNSARNFSAMNTVAMGNTEGVHEKSRGKLYCTIVNPQQRALSAKRKWNAREDKGKPMMNVLYIL